LNHDCNYTASQVGHNTSDSRNFLRSFSTGDPTESEAFTEISSSLINYQNTLLGEFAMPRIYRRDTDSSVLRTARTFTRVFCERLKLADTVRFYEAIMLEQLDQDIDLSENGMRIVAIIESCISK